jgi:hypothetical protein
MGGEIAGIENGIDALRRELLEFGDRLRLLAIRYRALGSMTATATLLIRGWSYPEAQTRRSRCGASALLRLNK